MDQVKTEEGREAYKHPEAFALMLYRCERCTRTEVLWNSRDGVTPYSINCIHGCPDVLGCSMFHILWKRDRCVPDFVPSNGMRKFIDITRKVARAAAEKRVTIKIKGFETPTGKALEDLIDSIEEGIYGDGHQPDIVLVTEGPDVPSHEVPKALAVPYGPRGSGRFA